MSGVVAGRRGSGSRAPRAQTGSGKNRSVDAVTASKIGWMFDGGLGIGARGVFPGARMAGKLIGALLLRRGILRVRTLW